MENENVIISVVVPARNEEKTIAACIESIMGALKKIKGWEIILVDSCSSDHTVNIAIRYPIRIIQLKKNWFMSPSAGRYMGERFSRGQYIFFIDADMKVNEDVFMKALNVLEENDSVAGVTGKIKNMVGHEEVRPKKSKGDSAEKVVHYLGGPAIYKNRILKEVGHFNPFLNGYEERELGLRIEKKKYKQIKISDVICEHYIKEGNISEAIEKASYFIGVGQFLRMHLTLENIYKVIIHYKIIFLFIAASSLYIMVLLSLALLKKWIFIVLLLSFALSILIFTARRKNNLKKVFLYFCQLFLSSKNLIYGFIKFTKNADDYPLDPTIIK